MNDVKLLPCPFCGETEIATELDHFQGTKWGYAICTACGAKGPETRTGYDADDDAPWRNEAVDMWNARADKAEALLAEAVEALEDIAKPRYGLQAVLEDGGSDDDIAHYYQSVCTQYHSIARATLARIKEDKDNG